MKFLKFFTILLAITVLIWQGGCTSHDGFALTPVRSPETTRSTPTIVFPSASPNLPASPSPMPTLGAEEARLLISSLLENNGGCSLPCWWGIEPGITKWEYARAFLSTFVNNIVYDGMFNSTKQYEVLYLTPDQNGNGRAIIVVENQIVTSITVDPPGNEVSFSLDKLLAVYGLPGEVYIRATATLLDSYLPFDLFVYYPQKSILAHYTYSANNIGNVVRSCPNQDGPELILWEQDNKIVWASGEEPDITKIISIGFVNFPPQKLRDVTDLSVQTFFDAHRDPALLSCIETPVKLWP
jgi:hypothetical protein